MNLQYPDRCIYNVEPTNQPMSKGRSHTILQFANENYCVVKSSKILCVKMKNGKESLYVRMNNNGGDVNCKCVSIFAQSWGEWKIPAWMMAIIFPSHSEVNHGGVCMWVRTDSPTTPLPKDHNCLNHQHPFLMKVVGISKGRRHMGIFPLGPKLWQFPHILILGKNHALFSF